MKSCNRINPLTGQPFSSVAEMDAVMTLLYNRQITPQDTCYILGDVAFRDVVKYMTGLNGKKILILGNHDYSLKRPELHKVFVSVQDAMELKTQINGERQSIYLHHYSCRVWPKKHYGAWHLYGHSHNTLPPLDKSFDCGVDTNQFKPYSLSDVAAKMQLL